MSVKTRDLPAPPILAPAKHTWGLAHYLALCAVPFLFWYGWTVVAWLSDGPHQITAYRDSSSASWYAARVLEVLMFGVMVWTIQWVVRGCIRARRFTFEAMFITVGPTLVWTDSLPNFLQAGIWLPTSNFLNVNAMCGYMPFLINPECGKMPDPLMFIFGFWLGGYLFFCLAMNKLAQWGRRRWPMISNAKLALLIIGTGVAIDLAFEIPAIALGLWTYPAPDWMSIELGHATRYALIQIVGGGCWLGLTALVYVFRDDKGRTFVERRLDHLSPLKRGVISWLALCTVLNFNAATVGTAVVVYGPYAEHYPKMPPHLVNGQCDVPGSTAAGTTDTLYGPCPGSDGYLAPVRKLPNREARED